MSTAASIGASNVIDLDLALAGAAVVVTGRGQRDRGGYGPAARRGGRVRAAGRPAARSSTCCCTWSSR